MKITRFEDLECWQEARKLTNAVFALTTAMPIQRNARLIDQMTGAAISVMNNIVEGFDSQANSEFVRFLGYARRSASEVQTCLYVAADNQLIRPVQFESVYQQAEKARKIVDGFRRYLRGHQRPKRAQPANRPTGLTGTTGQQANRPTGQRD